MCEKYSWGIKGIKSNQERERPGMKKKEKLTIGLLLIIAGVIVSLPLFGNTLFSVPVQDTFFHTQRIWSIKNALAEGQFPVRIYSEIYDGYGYGASLFYPDIFLYFPAILCLLGCPLVVSYNIFLIVINFATIAIAYYSYSSVSKSQIVGALAAVLYSLSTYRLLDLYTRGAMGEYLALIFCPLAFCGLTLVKRGEYRKWWVLALAYTGLLQSHMLSFAMMAVVAVLYALVHIKDFLNKRAIFAVVKAVFAVFLLNAWFLIPLLQVSGMNVIAFLGTDSFWQTDASLIQLFDVLFLSAGGHEVYTSGIADSMPKTPGVMLLLGAILAVFALVLYYDRISGEERKRIWGCLIPGALAALMITNLFPWTIVQRITALRNFFEKFQFMWRFNILAVLFLSLAAAYGFYYFFMPENTGGEAKEIDKYKVVVVITMAVCVSALIFLNQFIKQADQYGNEQVMENGFMDRLYVVPGFPYDITEEIDSNLLSVEYSDIIRGSRSFSCDYACGSFEVTGEEEPYIEVPLTYYPGYKAYIDGEEAETECSIWGVIRVYLPEDNTSGHLQVYYEEGLLVTAANIVSLMTILAFCVAPAATVLRKRTKEKSNE